VSSFRHARALMRNPITHVPALGLAVASVVVAVAPLTASASAKPAATSTTSHAVVQHAAAAAKKTADTKKSTTVTTVAAKTTTTTKAAAPHHTPSKAGHKRHQSATAESASSTSSSSKPYSGVSMSALEPTGTEGSQQSFSPNSDQWNNATAIVQAAKDLNLSPYAATIAVATALQESTLRNLSYGDRDSVGLFQQRPSMGWGTESELTNPSYAAKAFLKNLPSGYQSMSLSDAAQSVQRSFDGSLYSQWESQAAYMVHTIANS
jgi:hypothetical protein